MGSKIRVLSDDTINKIAAGEVIENPSSVVKELVDNSLDAGATEIIIEIMSGGRQLIRISDNGFGMNPDDALLCLERHGTSKIKSIEDLHSVMTMGFRGEAIPSIASISKFILITSPREESNSSSEGTMVVVEGGRLVSCSKAVRSPGTTIEVKSLFYNVPVRKKFQKSPAYDTGEIVKMISSLALANPHVQFQLISDQQVLIKTQSSTCEENSLRALQERVKTILGAQFLDSSLAIDCQLAPYRVWGLIGNAQHHRTNRKGQYLVINKRPVFSPVVSVAVKEGYGTLLPPNKHPVFVLHLEMISSLVDVNVHPQKKEVRLRQEGLLKHVISEAVSKALQSNFAKQHQPFISHSKEPLNVNLTEEPFEVFSPDLPIPTHFAMVSPAFNFTKDEFESPSPSIFKRVEKKETCDELVEVEQELPLNLVPAKIELPKILMILPGYLLISPLGNKHDHDPYHHNLCLIDQRRAHHRIIFEQMSQTTSSPSYSQKLVVPFSLEFSPHDKLILNEYLPFLQKLGFNLQEFGKNTFLIDAIPHDLKSAHPEKTLKELLNSLREGSLGRSQAVEKEKLIAQVASQFITHRKNRLTIEEAGDLLQRLLQCQTPYQCPYGKPTHLFITPEEIKKYF